MATIDWKDPSCSEGEIVVEMISQKNLTATMGIVTGVNLDESSITYSYYSNCRVSGRLSLINSNWVRGPFIRITYSLPKYNYKRVLGTFVVTNESPEVKNGQYTNVLTLQSAALYTMSTDIMPHDWTINRGISARTVMHQMMNSSERPYIDRATKDHYFSTPVVMENNTTLLANLYTLAKQAGVRLDADDNGYVLITNALPSSSRSPVYVMDLADPRGVVIDGVKPTSDYFGNPGRIVVEYNGDDNTVSESYKKNRRKWDKNYTGRVDIIGEADAASGTYTDFHTRGYQVTKFISVKDMSPSTQSKANQLARQYLKEQDAENIEWSLTTIYLPIRTGDGITLHVAKDHVDEHYSGNRHCFVKSIEMNLQTRRMRIVLKETTSFDKDEK